MTIPNRLSQHDDIRSHILHFEAPQMGTNPPETGLDFIGNAQSTRFAYISVDIVKDIHPGKQAGPPHLAETRQ